MTKETVIALCSNGLMLIFVSIWINYIGRKVISTIDAFELRLEKEFVKKCDFNNAIADAKEGRKNLWEEGHATNERTSKIINEYALQFTKEMAILKTKLDMIRIPDEQKRD